MKRSTADLIKLGDRLIEAIERDGALSRTRARELFNEDPVEIDKAFARLVLQDRAIWITGLPKQGIFFTLPSNKGKFGLPLTNHLRKRANGKKAIKRRGRSRDLYSFLEGWGEGTIDDIAKDLGWSRDSVKRNLAKLELDGVVVSEVLYDGTRGRPPRVWSRVDDTGPEDEVEVDFSQWEAMRLPDRRGGG